MILERSKNSKRNILFGFLNQIIVVVLPFIIRTILIKELGIEYVGLSGFFSSILSFLSLTELGFDSAVVIIMYGAIAKDDYRQINALLAFIKKAYFIIGTIILCLGLLCLPFLPYLISDLSRLPSDIDIYHIYIVFLLGAVVSYFFGGYRQSLVVAYQRNDIIQKIGIIGQLVFFFAQVWVITSFHSYYYYIYTLPILAIVKNVLLAFISKRKFPQVEAKGRINEDEVKQIKKLVAGAFISKVGARISITIDNIIISSFLGVTLLGYYSNYYYIANSVIMVLYIVYTSLQGGLGNAVHRDSVEKNRSDMAKLHFIYNWLTGWLCYTMLFLFQPFMRLWLGEEGMLPNFVVILLCLFVYQSECFSIFATYKNAVGIVWEDRWRPLVSGLFNLIINLILVLWLRRYGEEYALIGIVASTVLSYGLVNCPWYVSILYKKYYKTGLKKSYLTTYFYFSVVILAAIVSYPLYKLFPAMDGVSGWINLALRFLLCLILPNLIFFIVYHNNKVFKDSKAFLLARIKL